jgi:hypothetical protein
MDKCTLRGAGDRACAGVERSAVVGIEGQLRRLRVCGVHFEFLGEESTPLGVEDPGTTQTEPKKPRKRGRPRLSRDIATACLLDDGTQIAWPAVRAKLKEWGRDVPSSGPIPPVDVEYFKGRYVGEAATRK